MTLILMNNFRVNPDSPTKFPFASCKKIPNRDNSFAREFSRMLERHSSELLKSPFDMIAFNDLMNQHVSQSKTWQSNSNQINWREYLKPSIERTDFLSIFLKRKSSMHAKNHVALSHSSVACLLVYYFYSLWYHMSQRKHHLNIWLFSS